MNDDMTRARSTLAEEGGEARAKPLLSRASLLRQSLQGAVFPLSVEQLVRVGRENAAPAEFLTLLSGLPRGAFRSLEAVEFALESQTRDRALSRSEPSGNER